MSINLTDEIEVKTKKGKLSAAKQIFLEGDTQTVEKEIQDINSRHNTLNTKHESLSRTVQGISATGGASTANNVTYNNDSSGLNAENAQDAIDELQSSIADETTRAKAAEGAIIFDVSAHNNGATFESLSALLNSSDLNTLIPTSVRRGGMSIRFVQSSDNKYVQYRLMLSEFNAAALNAANWQGVDDEPTANSENLVKSGGVAKLNGHYIDDKNYVYVIADNEKRVLAAINKDNTFLVNNISSINAEIDNIKSNSVKLNDTHDIAKILSKSATSIVSNFIVPYNNYKNVKKDIIECSILHQNPVLILINNQESFNAIQTTIAEKISLGFKHIIIKLNADVLYFNERHIALTLTSFPNAYDVDISIFGSENCKVIAAGNDYNIDNASAFNGNKYSLTYNNSGVSYINRHVFLNDNLKEVSIYSDIKFARSKAEAISGQTNYYKLLLQEEDANKNPKALFLTCQFGSSSIIVDKIEDGYVYFYYDNSHIFGDLRIGANTDYSYSSGTFYPRYKLIFSEDSDIDFDNKNYDNIHVSCKYKKIHDCSCREFIYIENAFRSVEIAGINFIGNADESFVDYDCENNTNGLISIKRFYNEYVYIHGCKFESLRSPAIGIAGGLTSQEQNELVDNTGFKCRNIKISNNIIKECYRGLVNADGYTCNIQALNNIAHHSGKGMYYEGCIALCGQNILVYGNKITDFYSHNAIKSAHEWSPTLFSKDYAGTESIIENNIIGWSQEFRASGWKYGLMDSGAIYNYCRSKGTIIRNNVIYGYTGMWYNFAINLDGNSNKVSIIDNVLINAGNEYSIKTSKGDGTGYYGTDVFIMGNIFTYGMLLEGGNNTIKGVNFIIPLNRIDNLNDVQTYEKSKISFEQTEDDYMLFDSYTIYDKIVIPKKYTDVKNWFINNKNVIGSLIFK